MSQYCSHWHALWRNLPIIAMCPHNWLALINTLCLTYCHVMSLALLINWEKKWLVGKELVSPVLWLTLAISLWLTLAHSDSTLLSLSHSGSLALTQANFGSLSSSLCLSIWHLLGTLRRCWVTAAYQALIQLTYQCFKPIISVFSAIWEMDYALFLVPRLLQNLLL